MLDILKKLFKSKNQSSSYRWSILLTKDKGIRPANYIFDGKLI